MPGDSPRTGRGPDIALKAGNVTGYVINDAPPAMAGCAILVLGKRPPDYTQQVRTVVNLSSYAELAVRLANTAVQAAWRAGPAWQHCRMRTALSATA